MRQTPTIPPEDIAAQLSLCDQVRALLDRRPGEKRAYVDTYGRIMSGDMLVRWKGAAYVRPLFIGVTSILIGKQLWDLFFK